MELKHILEAILFASQKPLAPHEFRTVLAATADQSEDPAINAFKKIKEEDLLPTLDLLEKEYAELGRSFRLLCVAGSWQFVSNTAYAPWLRTFVGEKSRPARLSQPALETLTIIAYRQPLTRAEIEQIRGVSVDGVMQTLNERGLIEQLGRAEVVGRPMTYGTTQAFLEYFGLRDLRELPAADELRRIPVNKPEALLTADPNPPTPAPTPASAPASDSADQPSPNEETTPLPPPEPSPAVPATPPSPDIAPETSSANSPTPAA